MHESEEGPRTFSRSIPDFVGRALRRHRAAQAERLLMIGLQPELLVDNGIGEPWLPASFSTGWRRFAAAHEEVVDELQRDAAMRMDRLLGG